MSSKVKNISILILLLLLAIAGIFLWHIQYAGLKENYRDWGNVTALMPGMSSRNKFSIPFFKREDQVKYPDVSTEHH